MKKELRRIKTNYALDVLELINNLEGPEWTDVPFSIKIEKLLCIAFAYEDMWESDKVFDLIKAGDGAE